MVPSPGHTQGQVRKLCRNSNSWALAQTDLCPKLPHVILVHGQVPKCTGLPVLQPWVVAAHMSQESIKRAAPRPISNLCKNPVSSANHNSSYHKEVSLLDTKVDSFLNPNTDLTVLSILQKRREKKNQHLSLEFSSLGLELRHPCLYLTLRTFTRAGGQAIFYSHSVVSTRA